MKNSNSYKISDRKFVPRSIKNTYTGVYESPYKRTKSLYNNSKNSKNSIPDTHYDIVTRKEYDHSRRPIARNNYETRRTTSKYRAMDKYDINNTDVRDERVERTASVTRDTCDYNAAMYGLSVLGTPKSFLDAHDNIVTRDEYDNNRRPIARETFEIGAKTYNEREMPKNNFYDIEERIKKIENSRDKFVPSLQSTETKISEMNEDIRGLFSDNRQSKEDFINLKNKVEIMSQSLRNKPKCDCEPFVKRLTKTEIDTSQQEGRIIQAEKVLTSFYNDMRTLSSMYAKLEVKMDETFSKFALQIRHASEQQQKGGNCKCGDIIKELMSRVTVLERNVSREAASNPPGIAKMNNSSNVSVGNRLKLKEPLTSAVVKVPIEERRGTPNQHCADSTHHGPIKTSVSGDRRSSGDTNVSATLPSSVNKGPSPRSGASFGNIEDHRAGKELRRSPRTQFHSGHDTDSLSKHPSHHKILKENSPTPPSHSSSRLVDRDICSPESIHTPRGLTNPAGFCYLNCVIQLLKSCKDFKQSVLLYHSNHDIVDADGTDRDRLFVNDFCKLFLDLSKRNSAGIKRSLEGVQSYFVDKSLGDDIMQSFMTVLTTIHNIVNTSQFRFERTGSLTDPAEKAFSIYKSRNTGFVFESFYGQLSNIIICKSCGRKMRESHQLFKTLSVPVPKTSKVTSLEKCVESFFEESEIESGISPGTKNCNCKKDGEQRLFSSMEITHAPKYLFIYLNRGSYNTGDPKNNTFVKCEEVMVLPIRGRDIYYHLISVVDHVGDNECGHYYVKTSFENDHWYIMNDNNVRPLKDLSQLVTKDAIVFLFKIVNITE